MKCNFVNIHNYISGMQPKNHLYYQRMRLICIPVIEEEVTKTSVREKGEKAENFQQIIFLPIE